MHTIPIHSPHFSPQTTQLREVSRDFAIVKKPIVVERINGILEKARERNVAARQADRTAGDVER